MNGIRYALPKQLKDDITVFAADQLLQFGLNNTVGDFRRYFSLRPCRFTFNISDAEANDSFGFCLRIKRGWRSTL